MDTLSLAIPKANSVKCVTIDFDGTLYNRETSLPYAQAAESLKWLRRWGYDLYIYSARAKDEAAISWMKGWLNENRIPFDTISNIKPPRLTWLIDDRGICFADNWEEITAAIKKETFPWKQ